MSLIVAFATGLLLASWGVGDGFYRMRMLFYLVGVPVPVAVGTAYSRSFSQVALGASCTLLVALSISLSTFHYWIGSALRFRMGAAAISIVHEDDIKVYFGVILLLGAIAVAVRKIGGVIEMPCWTRWR